MSDIEKLTAKLAAKFLIAHIESGGVIDSTAYAEQCLNFAKTIVSGATSS